jgi:c-di-GMP phosphodiesterase
MNPADLLGASAHTPCFFAKQPIFDPDLHIWGYQLLYRRSEQDQSARLLDHDQATVQLVLDAGVHVIASSGRQHNLLIEFSPAALTHQVPYALPAQGTVIKISLHICQDPALSGVLADLQGNGYRIALDGLPSACAPLLPSAAMVIVDALADSEQDFHTAMSTARQTGLPILVKRIEDHQAFDLSKKLGATLFSGFFFQKPVTVSLRKLSSMQVVRLKLLKLLNEAEDNRDELIRTMQADVSLTYRLLKLINSPFFGIVQPIDTVTRAISYMGWKQARIWLRMIILTDLVPPEKTSQLPLRSAQRARFLELLGQSKPGVHPDELFLLGLFSLLDAIFDMPMAKLTEYLPLTEDIKVTLQGGQSQSTPWLRLVEHFERGQWDAVEQVITDLRLDPLQVGSKYNEASTWAENFFISAT